MYNYLEDKLKSFDDTEIFYRKDMIENSKAVVVIVHGLCEHLGRYDYFTKRLNEAGYTVYRFDNRGHGKSAGERGYVDNFQDFFTDADKIVNMAIEENKHIPVFMFGHSMGGFITAGYGMKYTNKLKGQILSGAAVIELPIFEDLKRDKYFESHPMEKSPNALSSLICRDKKVVDDYDNDPLVLKETNLKLLGEAFVKGPVWIKENVKNYTYPCLILHGENDQIVIKEASRWLFENINSKDKTIRIYPKCYHEILNEKEEKHIVIDDILNWIEAKL